MLSLERASHAESLSLMFSFWISHSSLLCQHSPSPPCPTSCVRWTFGRGMFWNKLDFLLGSAAVPACSKQCPVSWVRGIHHTRLPLGKIWTATENIWAHLLKKLIPITASLVSLNCSLNPCSLFPTSSQHSGHILYEMCTNCFLWAKEQLPKASSAQLPGACLDGSSSILHWWMLSASHLTQSAPHEGVTAANSRASYERDFVGSRNRNY